MMVPSVVEPVSTTLGTLTKIWLPLRSANVPRQLSFAAAKRPGDVTKHAARTVPTRACEASCSGLVNTTTSFAESRARDCRCGDFGALSTKLNVPPVAGSWKARVPVGAWARAGEAVH